MAKTIFSIRYKVIEEKREEYLDVIRELKNLVKAEGLTSYTVFEDKVKKNNFLEVYAFESQEDYENFDDDPDERVDLLMNKLSDVIEEHSTVYSVLNEI